MSRIDRVKLVCLVLFFFALGATIFVDTRVTPTAHAFSSGPPAGYTGAPLEQTCAISSCHQGSLNGGPGELTIVAPTMYETGKTYQIMVKQSTTDSSRRRWGFQLTALTAANKKAGNLASLNGTTAILDDDGPGFNRQYIEHRDGGTFQGQTGQASWTFRWTAPDTDAGPVIFYAAGNQSNNDGTNNGDQIYTVVEVVPSGPPEVTDASVNGKKLIVAGQNFDVGAVILLNGEKEKKVSNDDENVTSMLIGKKSGKKISRGQTVMIQVKNPDGTLSNEFSFTRPL